MLFFTQNQLQNSLFYVAQKLNSVEDKAKYFRKRHFQADFMLLTLLWMCWCRTRIWGTNGRPFTCTENRCKAPNSVQMVNLHRFCTENRCRWKYKNIQRGDHWKISQVAPNLHLFLQIPVHSSLYVLISFKTSSIVKYWHKRWFLKRISGKLKWPLNS